MRRFPTDGGLLLFERRTRRLFAYNETARVVWDLLAAERPISDAAAEISYRWGVAPSRARADVQAILSQWRAQGVLAGGRSSPAAGPATVKPLAGRRVRPSRTAERWICTFRGVAIAFTVDSDKLAAARAMLAHLETPAAKPQVQISVIANGVDEFVLRRDGRELARTGDLALVMGGLWQMVLESVYPETRWLALMHGAAMARDGNGIALSAPSGSGKSTLAAGLLRAKFDFLADDLVPMSAPDGMIVPWPLPLSIKPGSASIVGRFFPQLATAPPYRTKGMQARLLAPPASAWELHPVPLKWLVFPRFVEGGKQDCRRISAFEAIERLLLDRIWLGCPLHEANVAAFVDILNATPAFALSYGALDDGVRMVKDIVA